MEHFNLSQLSESERALLTRDLLESAVAQTDGPLSPEEITELRQRAAAVDNGEVRCIPWEDALAAILKKRAL